MHEILTSRGCHGHHFLIVVVVVVTIVIVLTRQS